MNKVFTLATALTAACSLSLPGLAFAADNVELREIRAEIKQMRESYEARLKSLEQRLQAEQEKNAKLQAQAAPPTMSAGSPPTSASPAMPATPAAPESGKAGRALASTNQFNPAISLILAGTYANLSQDPETFRLPGPVPGSRLPVEAATRGFSLGESELTLSAAIDPHFSGQLTFALDGNEAASVEEAFVDARELGQGVNLRFGRFFSGLGYQNSQHGHVWDFVDTPLAYQAILDGQASSNGLQLKWLAPIDRFLELGVEIGKSTANAFAGTERNKNGIGSSVLFAHLGDDLGANASWRVGLSYLRSRADDLEIQADDAGGVPTNVNNRHSKTWIADGVFKWAPQGNSTQTYFKLQGEYLRRTESGDASFVAPDTSVTSAAYQSRISGWYLQGIYQFSPNWRAGVRHDHLSVGNQTLAGVALPSVLDNPKRTSVMLDWNRSEFSRIRLQLARDKTRPDVIDNQIFLQYIMSLGAHGAHRF